MSRQSYPSDVSDEEWAFVAPYLALMKKIRASVSAQCVHRGIIVCHINAQELRKRVEQTDLAL